MTSMREDELVVQPGQSATFSARIEADPADVKQISQDIHFTLVAIDNDKLKVEETGVFIGSGIR